MTKENNDTALTQSELQRMHQRRMYLAQTQYNRSMETANVDRSNTLNLNAGYPSSRYKDADLNYESRNQAIPSSFPVVSSISHSSYNPPEKDRYSSMLQETSESNDNLAVSQSTKQLNTSKDERFNDLRQQLLLEVLSQIDVNNNKTNVALRKLNSDSGVAFDWGTKMPRIREVRSVHGIAESSLALNNDNTSTSKSPSSDGKEDSPEEQSSSNEQVVNSSKMKVSELAKHILSGTFDGLLTKTSAGDKNEQTTANKLINSNHTQDPTRGARALVQGTSYITTSAASTHTPAQPMRNGLGVGTHPPVPSINSLGANTHPRPIGNSLGASNSASAQTSTTTSIQKPIDDRLVTYVANKIIGSFNQQSQSNNLPSTMHNSPNQMGIYNRQAYTPANKVYERNVVTGQTGGGPNIRSDAQVRNHYTNQGRLASVHNQAPIAALGHHFPRFVTQGQGQVSSQNQRGHQRPVTLHHGQSQGQIRSPGLAGANQTTLAYQRSMAANQAAYHQPVNGVDTTGHVRRVSEGQVTFATQGQNNQRTLRNINLEHFYREIASRGQIPSQSYTYSTSIPSRYTNNEARTARVIPLVSRTLATPPRAVPVPPPTNTVPESVKTTNPTTGQSLLDKTHDWITCVDCFMLGTCPIKKSIEASKSKEKDSNTDDDDDIVITKVTTKDADKGPVERIDVDEWAESAPSSPERVKIKQEPVDDTSCVTTDKTNKINTVVSSVQHNQEQHLQEVELSPIDETPVTFPVVTQFESHSAASPLEPGDSRASVVNDDIENDASINTTTSEPVVQDSDGEQNALHAKEGIPMLRLYDDILYEVMDTKDKRTLADLENKLEENKKKLNGQTVSWIRKHILKARLAILKKMERIRTKYELAVANQLKKQTPTIEYEEIAETEKEGSQVVIQSSAGNKAQDNGEQTTGTNTEEQELTVMDSVLDSDITQENMEGAALDAAAKDEPMTLEDAVKSLYDIPLPGEEERASMAEKCGSNLNSINDNLFNDNRNNLSQHDNSYIDDRTLEDINCSTNDYNNRFEDTESNISKSCIQQVVSPVYERKASIDINCNTANVTNTEQTVIVASDNGEASIDIKSNTPNVTNIEQTVNVASENGNAAPIQQTQKLVQKTAKRKCLDTEEHETKRKKEKTEDKSSSSNIWERLKSKYSFS